MNKELPNIYRGQVSHNTNKKVSYGLKNLEKTKDKINRLFRENEIYKKDVVFETQNKQYDTKIIGKTNEHIITINNDVIKINDIIKFDIK